MITVFIKTVCSLLFDTSAADRIELAKNAEKSILEAVDRMVLDHPDPCGEGSKPSVHVSSCVIAIGMGALKYATTMNHTIAVGRCAGASLTTESRDLLIGDYTAAPRGQDGFVNIANKLCFWRDSGERVACPPPEPECANVPTEPAAPPEAPHGP